MLDQSSQISILQKQIVQLKERVVYLETIENAQKKELEEHIDVLLKMEQERLLIIKEKEQSLKAKEELAQQNQNYMERIGQFEKHLGLLKDEISNSQMNYKAMMEEKDKIIDQLKTENQAITEKVGRLRKQANVSSQKSMTGLPQSVVKEKQSNTLKFKTKQR